MRTKTDYGKTMTACFIGYIVQAVVNNFVPLLFVTLRQQYQLKLTQITLLVTINFCVQLLVDLVSVKLVDRIGYKTALLLAHGCASAGLAFLAVLPDLIPVPYAGLLLCVILYAVGGGLLEVVVSPVMEACPTDNKEAAMSLLHSFYCWGFVGVVLLSTLFFRLFGIRAWRILALLWALVPLGNLLFLLPLPVPSLLPEGEKGMSVRQLMKSRLFWILMLLMICAGACEQAVSQWASSFAEQALHVGKTTGDLAGPMMFAILMGIARTIYGKYGDRLPLKACMTGSGLLCLFTYLLIALSPSPGPALLGCALCGFSVGILWPGTFSMAAAAMPSGGTALFALLALGGDVGCSGGPTFVGFCSGLFAEDLRKGILCAVLFPLLLLAGLRAKDRVRVQ